MFRKNEGYRQQNLFGVEHKLTKRQKKIWEKSKEHKFFLEVFSKIKEDPFRVLYSSKKSRPNVAVNQLVGSLMLKHLYDWTYEELFSNVTFNMLSRHAIGINDWQEDAFAPASLYNFQNRVISHFLETGEDLFMDVFDSLVATQLKEFGVASNIQRGDSFLMGSNIMDFSRITLLVAVLQRVHRILKDEEKLAFKNILDFYTEYAASQYSYNLAKEDIPKELTKLAGIYHQLYLSLKETHQEEKVFIMFERVYFEHFKVNEEKVQAIPAKQLHSGIIMSPDDLDATYRRKGNVLSKGFVGHLSETANPENKINLITDIGVESNNTDDAKILEDRLPEMLKKTPDIQEYHADALYGNEQIDKVMLERGVKQIQSNIRGRKSSTGIRICKHKSGEVKVKCDGGQEVVASRKPKSWRVEFNLSICEDCPFKEECNTRISGTKTGNPHRYWTFFDKHILSHARFDNINTIPEKRRKIRANVEATVKEAKRGIKNGKLRVRGLIKAKYYLIWTSIAINLTRIHRLLT